MQIIIVGCGKVGGTLAEQLQENDIDLTLIDTNQSIINYYTEEIDAMGIVGNGASINTLMDAGIESADLLIAVTNSDELNLLCCLIAQKVGHCQTIARVRNPIYSQDIGFIKERLGLSMIINPELAAAREISRTLQCPAAVKIDPFSKGHAELLTFKVLPEHGFHNLSISQISQKYSCDFLFCAIKNSSNVIIPGGEDIIHDGDYVTIISTPQIASDFFKKIGMNNKEVKNSLIIGGGTLGYYLAKALSDQKINVKVIEQDKSRCEELSDLLPEVTIINGDGTVHKLLEEEGLARVESVIALTDRDEDNIFLSLYAKKNSSAKVIAKISRMSFSDIIEDLNIDSTVYPKYLTADYILRYVRAMQNTIGDNVETLYQILDNNAEALEFIVREDSPVIGTPLSELKLKDNLLVACITRNGKMRIPNGTDTIQLGDNVIVVTTHKDFRDIADIITK